jgi:outer membrane protein TolC
MIGDKIMMKKLLMFLFLIPLLAQAQDSLQVQRVESIKVLFDSLKTHPQTMADQLNMEKALMGKRMVIGLLYPKINAFGRYEYSNTPSGMLPLAPNDLLALVKDQTKPQPFSQNIFRVGVGVSMPVFALSLYTTAAKAKAMYVSAQAKARINLLQNEALLVSTNANLQYLNALIKALEGKKESLSKTLKIIQIQVKNGRAPKTALLKIQNALNEVGIIENNVRQQQQKAIAAIRSFTGITLAEPVPMTQAGTYQNGSLKVLDPLRKKTEAEKLAWRAEKEKLVPALYFNGNYNHSAAKAYNNDKNINEDYGTVALTLNIPLFAKSQYASIKKSRLDYESSQNDLKKMELELGSQARALENNLPLLNSSVKLYEQSVKDKAELLKIAKVAYLSHRMTVEDYLKYEDALVLEESHLYSARAKKWQTLMQLAVIYGNNIEQIVK